MINLLFGSSENSDGDYVTFYNTPGKHYNYLLISMGPFGQYNT